MQHLHALSSLFSIHSFSPGFIHQPSDANALRLICWYIIPAEEQSHQTGSDFGIVPYSHPVHEKLRLAGLNLISSHQRMGTIS